MQDYPARYGKGGPSPTSYGQLLIQDPPIVRFFFQSTAAAWLWLAVRIYVGYDFLIAGWHKFTTPAWVDGSGTGIVGFWKGALGTTPSGQPVITNSRHTLEAASSYHCRWGRAGARDRDSVTVLPSRLRRDVRSVRSGGLICACIQAQDEPWA